MAPFDDQPISRREQRGPLRIAVVGSGISGLSAAWLLAKSNDVTLFEKADRPGGHSNTLLAPCPEGDIPVDTGFIVYNEANYPNLTAMFHHLGVPTKPSNMSFSASLPEGRRDRFEYSGAGLSGLFGDRRNLVRLRMWRMVRDILRLYRGAPELLGEEGLERKPLGDFLLEKGFSRALRDDHLLPMCAAIWSLPLERVEEFPALSFLRFFDNHGLMRLKGRPVWRTVEGGSREYVKALCAPLGARVQTGRGVARIHRDEHGVDLTDMQGRTERFDRVVIASHSDEALGMLDDADNVERQLLGAIRYQKNVAWLHSDPSFMPREKRVWASWNYMGGGSDAPVCVTYWMNRLQSLPTEKQIFVTLNPDRDPAPEHAISRIEYDHPVFDTGAIAAQRALWTLQGHRHTWFCGAYFGSGFHEDGLQAGLAVAEELGGISRPWDVAENSSRIFRMPSLVEVAA